MAPLRRHRTSPRVIGREQVDAEGLPLIHLGFLDDAATPWPSQGAWTWDSAAEHGEMVT
jgi:hypothetical protein